jgi:cytochrome c2
MGRGSFASVASLTFVSLVALVSFSPIATLAAPQEPSKADVGEQILNRSCTTCHDRRPIETQALDEAGWTKEVRAMIDQGAEVKADEVPILVTYLVDHHGPLPEGPGKEVLLDVCTRCHDLQRVRRERLTPEGWLEILEAMLNEGAPLTDKDLPVLLRYLARNFGPQR